MKNAKSQCMRDGQRFKINNLALKVLFVYGHEWDRCSEISTPALP